MHGLSFGNPVIGSLFLTSPRFVAETWIFSTVRRYSSVGSLSKPTGWIRGMVTFVEETKGKEGSEVTVTATPCNRYELFQELRSVAMTHGTAQRLRGATTACFLRGNSSKPEIITSTRQQETPISATQSQLPKRSRCAAGIRAKDGLSISQWLEWSRWSEYRRHLPK